MYNEKAVRIWQLFFWNNFANFLTLTQVFRHCRGSSPRNGDSPLLVTEEEVPMLLPGKDNVQYNLKATTMQTLQ